MSVPLSHFSGINVPDFLWPDLIAEFGVPLTYHTVEGDVIDAVNGLLLEGAEGEFKAGGRYARLLIEDRDLPRPAQASDWVDLGNSSYDIESVDATHYGISRCVIKLSGQTWLAR